VSIRLLKASSVHFSPIDIQPELKEKRSLIFEFPVAGMKQQVR
jgi:hypothetical protein